MSQHIDPEVKQSFIVDNLTTNDAGKALSAAQGKKIFDRLGVANTPVSDSSISSFDDLKTYLNGVASSLTDGNVIAVIWYNNFIDSNIPIQTYFTGFLYKITDVFFTVNACTINGKHYSISRSNATWYIDPISDKLNTLNGKIATYNSVTVTGDTTKGTVNNTNTWCKRTYRTVSVQIVFTYTATTSSSWVQIGTIPSVNSPQEDIYTLAWDTTDKKVVFAYVSRTGGLGIHSAENGHAYFLFSTYIAGTAV